MSALESEAGRVRQPRQKRSRESLRRIYSAANDLLEARTFDQITIADISDLSRVSIGSIYQRFRGKDDLLWTLYDAYIDEAAHRIDEMSRKRSEKDLDSRIEKIVGTTCELFRSHRGIVRSLLLMYRQTPERVPESLLSRVESVYGAMRRFIAESSPPATSDDTIRFALAPVLAATRERILFADFPGAARSRRADRAFSRRLAGTVARLIEQGGD